MECTTGVRTAPMGAGWRWDTLADSACSHHIPSLAPAVALPAPRHDRRRTGAAGSPPGGFPFVEGRRAAAAASWFVPWTAPYRFATGAGLRGFPACRWSGRIAQLVEQLTLNQRVLGSSPSAPTIGPATLYHSCGP